MNIKQEKKLFNFDMKAIRTFFLGGNSTNDLFQYTLMATVGVWLSAFVIGTLTYITGVTNMVYLEAITTSLLISSIIGIGVVFLTAIGGAEFNSSYGWGIWRRSVLYNGIIFIVFYSISSGFYVEEQREKITSFELSTTDVNDCEYKVKMKSNTLIYEHCSNDATTQVKINATKQLNVYLIGKVRYGTNIADHYEFIESVIIVKE